MMRILILLFSLIFCESSPTKSTLTLDEFFDYVSYPSINLSPNGHYLTVQTRRALWDSSSYNNSLWLYQIRTLEKILITDQLSEKMKPRWSPNGSSIVFLLNAKHGMKQNIHIYCVNSQQLISIPIDIKSPLVLTWGNDDFSLYVATSGSDSIKVNENSEIDEWKDVIRYRKSKPNDGSTIYHLVLDKENQTINPKMNVVKVLPFQISDLLFSSSEQKLVFTSAKGLPTKLEDFEIYCMDPLKPSSLTQLTTNRALEENLSLSMDGKHVLFTVTGLGPNKNKSVITQTTLHALNLTSGEIQHLAKDFQGSITQYSIRPNGGVYILGQWGTNVQIYTQQSARESTVMHEGWQGTYQLISSSLDNSNDIIAFVHSSHNQPREVYIVDNIDQLDTATVITNENEFFTKKTIPPTKIYQWTNDEDNRTIEGILHFPPGLVETKNLPLLILIHGGPFLANTNQFNTGAGLWAPLAANEGWLVLEPNYRGSTGYGDQFLDEIRYHPLSRPGRDILSGIHRLIEDGIVDGNRLAVGGYSYGGFLTNWLITQATEFNVALSGAGSVDQASMWGTMDLNLLIEYLWGGFPWDSSKLYVEESPIYHFGKVRTPTLIMVAENDVRVPISQVYMLERALHHLHVPVQLLVFPNEGHLMLNNPWHTKIMVREELEWLQKYGHTTFVKT